MRRPCLSCSKDVIFSFLSAIAGPRDSKLLQNQWLRHSRLLSNQAQATVSDIARDQCILVQDSSAIEKPILSRHKSLDIDQWKTRRTAISQDQQEKHIKPKDVYTRGERRISGKDHASSASNGSASESGRKMDQQRDRSDARQGFPTKFSRGPTQVNKNFGRASRSISLIKPKKDRWRNRPGIIQDPVTSLQTRTVDTMQDSEPTTQQPPAVNQERNYQQDRQIPSRLKSMPKILRSFETPAEIPSPEVEKLEPWKVHKFAIKKKLDGKPWDPLKKLSPDARQGVRQLHEEDPTLWSTPNLAQHFEISPDAIRRILKSKWEPTEEEKKSQEERWVKRGETIWDRYVELGKKAPRRWRGLDPVPAPKRLNSGLKVEFKPKEWSQDRAVDSEQESAALGLGLGNRIV